MENFIITAVSTILLYTFFVVCWHKLLNKKIDLKDYKLYLSILIIDICDTTFNALAPQFLKVFGAVIILFLVNYIFFCRNITKNIIVVLVSDLIAFISETILAFILTLIIGMDLYNFSSSNIGILTINIGVALFCFVFLKLKFIYKFYNYLVKTFDNMKKSNLIIYFVLTIALITIFFIILYMDLPISFLLVCTSLLTIFYIAMLFRLANARENYKTVSSKYETSISSLHEYSDMMDKYKITNHENKNQLLTIRNMVDKKDKKTINYIDKLIDSKIKDDEKIFDQTYKIPDGSLRAIIYSKLCKMKDMNIKYKLDIANDVKTFDLIEIEDYSILNICKILGVYFDNAIEAVQNTKNKRINVEIYIINNELYVEISNNYQGEIKLDKINSKRYTTKGKGHGYGLALVDSLVKEDSNLTNETEINKSMFTQRLKIKM